ncbi:uncharacterized protein F4822DRAFT_432031 [Hypoxylon trugodes]|uniref:uncharacterized protein n=1 Tax=Hypoxylon trugodes TaxID=326681 RepID=UPI0021965D6C|nr:uncharacterized protein F4822DRAFT_432031 [Hypoxylon trugodes]KAI1385182.1 hypothetical protein F4822DRAFT_432031 [Hypoxylon trugodes]
MRSRPYTPPPPLPPLLAELSGYLPNRERRDGNDGTVPLLDLDPDTSRLLPPEKRQLEHRVRVQGRLAPVRSISVADLRRASHGVGFDEGVGGKAPRRRGRRRSEDDVGGSSGRGSGSVDGDGDGGEGDEEVGERDTQLRGYGIGGRGNIRRPTDVIGTSSRTSRSLSSLFPSSGSTTPRSLSASSSDKRWRISGLLNRIEERKGKDRCPT